MPDKEDLRFWKAELRNNEGFVLPGGNSSIEQDSTIETVRAFEDLIIKRFKAGQSTFIDFSAGFYVEKDFVEQLEKVVKPMQEAEKAKFYFFSFLGGQSHNGIVDDDLPEEENESK